MSDQLEKRIRQHAEMLRRRPNMPSAAKRSAAIRRGIQRSKEARPRRKGMIYGGIAAAVTAASMLLFVDAEPLQGVFGKSGTGQVAFPAQAPEWEPFLKLLNGSEMLSSAWERGLVEQADTAEIEENGMTLKVEGMIRDSRSLTLLYVLKSPEGEAAEWDTPELLDEVYGKETTAEHWIHQTYFDTEKRATYGYATLFFSGEAKSRAETFKLKVDAISLQSPEHRQQLGTFVVPLRLASTASQEQEMIYARPERLTVSGQTVQIHQVLLTPLSVYVNVSEDSNNPDKLFDLIEPDLTLTQGKQIFMLQKPGLPAFIEGRAGWEMSFINEAGIVNPDSLSFGVKGIQSLSKQKLNMVLNTERENVLQAPEDGFILQVTKAKANTKRIVVRYPVQEDEFGRLGSMRLDPVFKDADGKEHEMVSSEGTMQTVKGDSREASDTFYIPDQKYPQPLTFRIGMYPGGVRDEREVVLK